MTRDPGEKFQSTQSQFDWMDEVLGECLDALDDLLGCCGDEEDQCCGGSEAPDCKDQDTEEDTSDGI